ncbi:MAG: epoxyqueuosine reductase QueH [Erysipelotrichaceae bacterium]|nr:epoxyqueuosine reductase QueH [Erysipelotrichaceae bacterium]
MNNYQKHLQQIASLKGRPQLLIHICCGVCSVYPLQYLRRYFDVTVFFSNSNIYPYEEYEKKARCLETVSDILERRFDPADRGSLRQCFLYERSFRFQGGTGRRKALQALL